MTRVITRFPSGTQADPITAYQILLRRCRRMRSCNCISSNFSFIYIPYKNIQAFTLPHSASVVSTITLTCYFTAITTKLNQGKTGRSERNRTVVFQLCFNPSCDFLNNSCNRYRTHCSLLINKHRENVMTCYECYV